MTLVGSAGPRGDVVIQLGVQAALTLSSSFLHVEAQNPPSATSAVCV